MIVAVLSAVIAGSTAVASEDASPPTDQAGSATQTSTAEQPPAEEPAQTEPSSAEPAPSGATAEEPAQEEPPSEGLAQPEPSAEAPPADAESLDAALDSALDPPLTGLEQGTAWLSEASRQALSTERFTCSFSGTGRIDSASADGEAGGREPQSLRVTGTAQCLRVESVESGSQEIGEMHYGDVELQTDYFTRANGCDYMGVLGLGELELENGSGGKFGFNFLAWRGAGRLHLNDDGDPSNGTARGQGAIALLPQDGDAAAACLDDTPGDSLKVGAELYLEVTR